MESIWRKVFIKNTYSSIRGRGIHKCVKDLYKDLRNNVEETQYCLKLDIRKFYPSIDHEILYSIIQKKIKDKWLLTLLKGIIDSAEGVPIGNYLSQFFANLYLTYFDHWIKEEVKCKYYYRYADDIVILDSDKSRLRNILIAIKFYFHNILKLKLKHNYQIFPIEKCGIDFVGYIFRHKHILLRKSIKTKMLRLVNLYLNKKISKSTFESRMTSYRGWLKFCNSKHISSIIENITNYRISTWNGRLELLTQFNNKQFYIVEILCRNKYFEIHSIRNRIPLVIKSKNKSLYSTLNKLHLPYSFKYEHSKFQYKAKRHRTARK